MIKLLVADDEKTIREGIRTGILWKEIDCSVVYTAKNGLEVLHFLEENTVDIIISDVKMPRMSGLDLIKSLREKGSSVPVIFVSGYEDFKYIQEAMKYEASAFILKPINTDELQKEVQKICKKY